MRSAQRWVGVAWGAGIDTSLIRAPIGGGCAVAVGDGSRSGRAVCVGGWRWVWVAWGGVRWRLAMGLGRPGRCAVAVGVARSCSIACRTPNEKREPKLPSLNTAAIESDHLDLLLPLLRALQKEGLDELIQAPVEHGLDVRFLELRALVFHELVGRHRVCAHL